METLKEKYLKAKAAANAASRCASIADGKGDEDETIKWQKEADRLLEDQKIAFRKYMESDE